MRRGVLCLSVVAVLAGSGAALAAPDPVGLDPVGLAQRFTQGTVNQAGADCRIVDDADGNCSNIDGRDIDQAQITAYRQSWVHHALTLQRNLSQTAPLIEDQLPHTHNTFNASAYSLPRDGSAPSYYPTLTNQDPNQVYSISDQLTMDIRAIELDLHWVPSPYGAASAATTHGYWVTMCHGDGQQVPSTGAYVHVGCSDDRPAQDGFAEVRRWLDANRGQFLVIYLENQLYDAGPVADATLAHDTAASLLDQAFGSMIYRPIGTAPNRCATLPYRTSRAQMMAKGARVLLVGNCGPGAWSGLVFQRGPTWDESGDPSTYSATDCDRDMRLRADDSAFRREFEDSTFVSAATAGAPHPATTPADVAAMVRCGVNIIGMDQLRPQDGRLAALVWSWATNEPSTTGTCAAQRSDARFHAMACRTALPAACRTVGGGWAVTAAAVTWVDAADECAAEFAGARFAVPMNGFRNQQLHLAHGTGAGSSAPTVWLNYAKVRGGWTAWAATSGGRHGRGHAFGRGHGTGRPGGVPLYVALG
jgi:hypothetical protein